MGTRDIADAFRVLWVGLYVGLGADAVSHAADSFRLDESGVSSRLRTIRVPVRRYHCSVSSTRKLIQIAHHRDTHAH